MKARLLMIGVIVVISAMLASELSPAVAQGNANTSNANRRSARRRKSAKTMRGVPRGVNACIEHLLKMAKAGEPYEGHPREIINNGLLWNDPRSHCAVTDQSLREKIFDVATAWQLKQMDKVVSLLEEIKGALPSAGARASIPGQSR
jgi:hypothetical protein